MDITLNKDENNLDAILTVNIKLEDIEEDTLKSLKKQKQQLNIPGFRKGKIPLGVAKKYLWEGLVKENLEKKLEKSIDDYIKKEEVEILKPLLPIANDKAIDLKSDKEFEFNYDIGIVENLEIDTQTVLKNIKKYEISIEKEDLEKEIDIIRNTFGKHTQPETIEDNKNIRLYLEFFELDEKEEKLEKGITKKTSKNVSDLPEKFKKELLGKKNEETIKINIDTTFNNRKEFAKFLEIEILEADDANATFEVEIISIHLQEKATMDEELFKKATQDKASNLEDFNKEITSTLEKMNERSCLELLTKDIHTAVMEKADIKLPIKFIDKLFEFEIEEKKKDLTEEELQKERINFKNRLKWSLITDFIAKENKIEVTNEEISKESYNYVINMYMQYGMQPQPDQMEDVLKEFLQKKENINYIQETIVVKKVMDIIIKNNEFKTKSISSENFKTLINKQNNHE
ncbi:MAG: trigger factor [Bacteroidota bacterium]|nr:trigger factor [Bacteroidota bacterium]